MTDVRVEVVEVDRETVELNKEIQAAKGIETLDRVEVKNEIESGKKVESFDEGHEESKVSVDAVETSPARTGVPKSLSKTTSQSAGLTSTFKLRYKVVFLGDIMTGKTSFISRFVLDNFNPVYQATIGIDFLSKSIQLEDKLVRLQLWDTAGQEKFRSLIPSYVRDASIIFVLYDIANKASFLNVDDWVAKVDEEKSDDTIVILIGNKLDLEHQREVTAEEGLAKATAHGMLFCETSAKTGANVKTIFRKAALALPTPVDELEKAAEEKTITFNTTNIIDGKKDEGRTCLC